MTAPFTLRDAALSALDRAVEWFELAMKYRAQAGEADDPRLAAAATALAEERGRLRAEMALLHKLDVERYRAGEMAP